MANILAEHQPGATGNTCHDESLRTRLASMDAFGRLRPRVSGPNQYQRLTRAQRLAMASAAGQFLASAGANFNEGYLAVVHTAGELLALGSLGILLLVCLQLLARGRGALPPLADRS